MIVRLRMHGSRLHLAIEFVLLITHCNRNFKFTVVHWYTPLFNNAIKNRVRWFGYSGGNWKSKPFGILVLN